VTVVIAIDAGTTGVRALAAASRSSHTSPAIHSGARIGLRNTSWAGRNRIAFESRTPSSWSDRLMSSTGQ
jgi:hypothetical protein